jgi:undecaprenyl diphosphate synthase
MCRKLKLQFDFELPFAQMVEMIRWCLELGIPYISVYAFSIDNFSRSAEEVLTLMQLAEAKYHELAQVCHWHGLLHSSKMNTLVSVK